MTAPPLMITNLHKRFTGVSATIANLVPHQAQTYDLRLVGDPLPGCPAPISLAQARALSRQPNGKPFAIWHVRRNPDMQAAIWARDVLGLPIKTVFTSAAQRRHSAWPRWLISRMDAVIATTPQAASFIENPAATIPHGIDTNRLTPVQNRDQAWADLGYGGTMGIATIGRIRPEKGTDIFVEAAIQAMANQPGLHALIIGMTARKHQPFEQALRARIADAGLTDRFHFTGNLDNQTQMPRILQALSLVVNLPRYEGYGVVPLEGLACETPFVCSDTGIYRELSAQNTHGLISPVGDAGAAAQHISALLASPDQRQNMGQKGRQMVATSMSIQHEAAQIGAVYERLWSGETFRP